MLANSTDLAMIVLPLGGFVWSFCHPEPSSSLQLEDELRVRVHLPKDTTLGWLEIASCLCGGFLKHHPGPSHMPHRYILKWHQPQRGICFLRCWTLKLSISWLPGCPGSSLMIVQAPAIAQATDPVAETPQLPKQRTHGLRRIPNADERSKSRGRIIYRPIHTFAGLPSAARSQPAH